MSSERVISLIDMDCFYVQCEQRLAPEFWSHPCAVAQYNNWKGGGLIAVNYEARSHGVKRGMRGNEAMALCPDLHIFSVPEVRGKADLSRYREASEQVFEAIKEFIKNLNPNIVLEKASVDEAFIDLTQEVNRMLDSSHPVPESDQLNDTRIQLNDENDLKQWLDQLRDNDFVFNASEIRLALGAVVVQRIRREILDKTEFKCSAGISGNKMLAKLCCAINKPNAQTILPKEGIDLLFQKTDIHSIRFLGGKVGKQLKQLFGINTMFELKCLELNQLSKHFDLKTAKWLKEMANGLDEEPVCNRQLSKSIGCGKNFPGKTALKTIEDIRHWIRQLSEELVERMTRDIQMNKRTAKLLVVGYSIADKDHNSRSLQLDQWSDVDKLTELVVKQVFNKPKMDPIVNLSLSASKFVDDCDDPSHNTMKLDNYFTKVDKNMSKPIDICSSSENNSKRLKSCPKSTKTLKDFWKCNTNSDNKCENRFNKSTDIEVIESNDTNNTSNDIILIEDTNEKPIKRGFFYRKLMQLRAEEREREKVSHLNKKKKK